ncbi:MAG: ABC transporter ATP-binding protein [Xanthomonadales bacterium]|nr:ABC transporter ATP-binding protein [Xanthomonadales bacterium]
MSDVEFKATRKVYEDGTVGLDDLDLRIEEGEFLVLLGPSGCGKSTALRLLAGLEDITDGAINIGGARVNDLPPGARGLGMVFQSYALYPHMTVRENLSFGLRRTRGSDKVPPNEVVARVDEAASMLDLEKALDKKPKELSGGQQQRVAIGRALVRRPKVLLMDEPLSNLDAKLRNRMRFELRRLHEMHGTTTLYVTHDQIEAMTLADRIAILKDGRLQQHDKPLNAYNQPANSFVASFLGTPAMNLIEGRAAHGRFEAGELAFDLPPHLADADGPGFYGIRPENTHISEGGVPFTLGGVEHLGGEAIFHLEAGGHWIKALWRRKGTEAVAPHPEPGSQQPVILTDSSALFFKE